MRHTVPAALLLAVVTLPALAGDGRLEINQASVDAAGGFPFTIAAPDNYVLTGNLTVPADTDGFVLTTSKVVFDLNGFSIASTATCNTGGCTAGTGMAIRGFSGIAHAHDTTVRNGFIRGFADNCLRLGSGARVHELRVSECGRNGISVAGGSLVTHNRVSQTGENGILMAGTAPAFAHNNVSDADLGGGGFAAIAGGRATGGNVCGDGSCTVHGARRYYLTTDSFPGHQALTACAAGFHFATLDEILQTASIRYDAALGLTLADSGSGPPRGVSGWIRTGGPEDSSFPVPGLANCDAWTSLGGSDFGTTVTASLGWLATQEPVVGAAWEGGALNCPASTRVWCVED